MKLIFESQKEKDEQLIAAGEVSKDSKAQFYMNLLQGGLVEEASEVVDGDFKDESEVETSTEEDSMEEKEDSKIESEDENKSEESEDFEDEDEIVE